MNTLFYGDNLQVLREQVPDESVDLIYLDPPFDNAQNYSEQFQLDRSLDQGGLTGS